jgi:hypothetical protein
MKSATDNTTPAVSLDKFDHLSQAFENGSFYGLEYILDDFFRSKRNKTFSANESFCRLVRTLQLGQALTLQYCRRVYCTHVFSKAHP